MTRSRKGGAVPGGLRRRYADLAAFAEKIGAEIASQSTDGGKPGRQRRSRSSERARIVLIPARRGGLVAILYPRPGAHPVAIARLVPMVKLRKLLDIAGAEARAGTALTAALSGI